MNQYYIFLNSKKTGPYNLVEIETLGINRNTLVWTKGMDEWKKASEVTELNSLLNNVPPPLPTHGNDGFYLYLKKNYKYIFITFGLSLICLYMINEHFYNYWLTEQLNLRYDSKVYLDNYTSFQEEIIGLQNFFSLATLVLGVFIVPIFYIFKKKAKK